LLKQFVRYQEGSRCGTGGARPGARAHRCHARRSAGRASGPWPWARETAGEPNRGGSAHRRAPRRGCSCAGQPRASSPLGAWPEATRSESTCPPRRVRKT
jgi:hypothetical protein